MTYYILDESGEPMPATNARAWAEWHQGSVLQRIVKRDTISEGVDVSTCFLGIDHALPSENGPLIWETMVFGGESDQHCERCGGSRSDALAMHERVKALVTR